MAGETMRRILPARAQPPAIRVDATLDQLDALASEPDENMLDPEWWRRLASTTRALAFEADAVAHALAHDEDRRSDRRMLPYV